MPYEEYIYPPEVCEAFLAHFSGLTANADLETRRRKTVEEIEKTIRSVDPQSLMRELEARGKVVTVPCKRSGFIGNEFAPAYYYKPSEIS